MVSKSVLSGWSALRVFTPDKGAEPFSSQQQLDPIPLRSFARERAASTWMKTLAKNLHRGHEV